jgi:hypothetical protein
MIYVPPEFHDLCEQFQLAALSYHGSREKMVSSAVLKLGDPKKKIIREFLSDLLDGNHAKEQITSVWANTGSDFFFRRHGDLVSFLRLILERT